MGTLVLDTETQGQRGTFVKRITCAATQRFLPKAKGKRHVANADDHLDLQEICLIRTLFQFPQTADCTARPSLPQAGEIRKCLFSTRKDSL